MNSSLINFQIPTELKQNFDWIVKSNRLSRTGVLVNMIQKYCRVQYESIEKDIRFNQKIQVNNKQNPKQDLNDEPFDFISNSENIYL